MSVEIESLDVSRRDECGALLRRCPGATFHHSVAFQEHYAERCERPVYLVFRKKGTVVAGLPAGICKSGDGLVLKSPFSASFAGFVFPGLPSVRVCLEALGSLRSWCNRHGISGLHIGQTPGYYGGGADDVLEYCNRVSGYSVSQYELSQVVPLRENPAEGFSEAARRNYRRAGSVGLAVEPSANLSASYDLINDHLTKLRGGTSISSEDYLALAALLGDKI